MYAQVTLRETTVDIVEDGKTIRDGKRVWKATYGTNADWQAIGETRGDALQKLGDLLPEEE